MLVQNTEFPSDSEMEEAIKNIHLNIFAYNVFDSYGEKEYLKDMSCFIQDYLHNNGANYSVRSVFEALYIWINKGSNLINVLSMLYPIEEDIKHRDNFNVCDLPCILNGITPQIGLNAKNWMYQKPKIINCISLINDAILANKIIPIHTNRQLAIFNMDFYLDVRLLPAMQIIEWIDNEKNRDSIFPLRLPEFIVNYKKSLPEYSDYKEENTRLHKNIEEYKRNIENHKQEICALKASLSNYQKATKESFLKNLGSRIAEDAKRLDIKIDTPMLIESIAICLDIRVSKADKTYNPNGTVRSGYSYDTIKSYVSGIVPDGNQGNKSDSAKGIYDNSIERLKSVVYKKDYEQFRKILNGIDL